MARKSAAPTRRERREERRREKAEAAETERAAAGSRKRWLALIAIATVGSAVAVHQFEWPVAWIGLAALVGVAAFLAVALGGLGASVPPRDRTKGSNIDFGS